MLSSLIRKCFKGNSSKHFEAFLTFGLYIIVSACLVNLVYRFLFIELLCILFLFTIPVEGISVKTACFNC